MKIMFSLLIGLSLVSSWSDLRADDISDEIAKKKEIEASDAATRKEANSFRVPDDLLKTLDYRDWPCAENNYGPRPEGVPVETPAQINGRVVKFYFSQIPSSRKPTEHKLILTSFVVESKSGQSTLIYLEGHADKAGSHFYVMTVRGVDRESREKIGDAHKYLDLLFKKVRSAQSPAYKSTADASR